MDYILILIYLSSILVSSIAFVKIFMGAVILESNTDIGSKSFVIDKPGYYGIWISGKIFKAAALDQRNIIIVDTQDQKKKSIRSFLTPRINGFSSGRFLLKYYYLNDETYFLKVSNEQEDSLKFLSKFMLNKSLLPRSTNFTYVLRKTYPEYIFPFILLGIVFPLIQLIRTIINLSNQV